MTSDGSKPVWSNALALYSAQFATYFFQLLTVPFLARVLRPESYGVVLFSMAFATWISIIIRYGFDLSAARDVARSRSDSEEVSRIVASVIGGKVLLMLGGLGISVVVVLAVPIFREGPQFLLLAWVTVLAVGFNPFWYFVGSERMKLPAAVNIIMRAAGTAAIFLLVRSPEDAWLVLALQGSMWLLGTAMNTVFMYRVVAFRIPALADSWAELKRGWRLFFFNSASNFYSAINTFILGIFASPAVVSHYGGAERLMSAARALIHPLAKSTFPRISGLMSRDKDRAEKFARLTFFLLGGLGLILASTAFIFASQIVDLILGPGYEGAVPVMQVLAFVILLSALNNVLGVQWLVPLGLDRFVNAAVLAAGAVNIALATVLAPNFGALGVAWAVVLSEALAAMIMFARLTHARRLL